MRGRLGPVIGSLVFFCIAPGTVAGWFPYLISRWRLEPAFLGIEAIRYIGGALAAAGLTCLVACFARFALEGRGTPAPVAPTETLVISGLYRYVRNPMYVAVVAIVVGQALIFSSLSLLIYAAVVWTSFHLFVLLYEEPALRRRYGHAYDAYQSRVPRWLPRF
jgi:protein-S-isoprenylcysteine O-methyltransferase Ste14